MSCSSSFRVSWCLLKRKNPTTNSSVTYNQDEASIPTRSALVRWSLAIFCICFDCSRLSRLTLGWVCRREQRQQAYSLQTKKKKNLPYLMAIIENARCSLGWVMEGSERGGARGRSRSCILMSVGVFDKTNSGCWPCVAHCGVLQQSHRTQSSLG